MCVNCLAQCLSQSINIAYFYCLNYVLGFPGGLDGVESTCNAETQVQSLGQKIPWRSEWLPTPVFLPGEFHGQRSLAGYSPWGLKESDTTE